MPIIASGVLPRLNADAAKMGAEIEPADNHRQGANSTVQGATSKIISEIDRIPTCQFYGRVAAVLGMLVECAGLKGMLSIGARCDLETRRGRIIPCEVVGFRSELALLMPFGSLEGVGLGCKVMLGEPEPVIYPDRSWLGRVV